MGIDGIAFMTTGIEAKRTIRKKRLHTTNVEKWAIYKTNLTSSRQCK